MYVEALAYAEHESRDVVRYWTAWAKQAAGFIRETDYDNMSTAELEARTAHINERHPSNPAWVPVLDLIAAVLKQRAENGTL
jgi:hypothetical protein